MSEGICPSSLEEFGPVVSEKSSQADRPTHRPKDRQTDRQMYDRRKVTAVAQRTVHGTAGLKMKTSK